MKKIREPLALFIAFLLGSCLLGFISGINLLQTSIYLAPAIFVIYLGKYFLHGAEILNQPVLGFTAKELGYVFAGSLILKIFISYTMEDFLYDILGIGAVEWAVVGLELLSLAALVVLLSKFILKAIPR